MRPAHALEREVGVEYYASDADGIGGRLRDRPEDFRVRELEEFETVPADADPGAYPNLVFRATLYDRDTNGFAADLADALGISRERISWAGTKDKRAVTTQLFAIRGWEDDAELPAVRNAEMEVVGRAGRPVLFGDLRGNAFEIVVRDPDRPETVEAVTRELRAFASATDPDDSDAPVGVPNYFGMQRFGSLRPISHAVGLAIVRDDWEGAAMTYLAEASEREPDDTREARAYVAETRDWKGALERFPRRLGYERAILHRLVERGGDAPADFRAGLEALPSNVQTLLVNAAQSYLFNRMLSERLDRGLPFARPVAGDVVCFADDAGYPDTDRLQRVTEGRVRTVTRHCERGRAFVTAPLVGTETDLGDGTPGEIEREVLSEVDLGPDDFDLPGEFGSTGTRRAVLVRTDVEVRGGDDADGNADAGSDDTTPARPGDVLTFSFSLPKGSYATVLLREYLKGDPTAMR